MTDHESDWSTKLNVRMHRLLRPIQLGAVSDGVPIDSSLGTSCRTLVDLRHNVPVKLTIGTMDGALAGNVPEPRCGGRDVRRSLCRFQVTLRRFVR